MGNKEAVIDLTGDDTPPPSPAAAPSTPRPRDALDEFLTVSLDHLPHWKHGDVLHVRGRVVDAVYSKGTRREQLEAVVLDTKPFTREQIKRIITNRKELHLYVWNRGCECYWCQKRVDGSGLGALEEVLEK